MHLTVLWLVIVVPLSVIGWGIYRCLYPKRYASFIVLRKREPKDFLIFEQEKPEGDWEFMAVQPAPDEGSACKFYLSSFFTDYKSRFWGIAREMKTIAVTSDSFRTTLGQRFPPSISTEFIYIYNGY